MLDAASWAAIRLSLLLAGSTTALLVLLGTPLAWWVARGQSRWRLPVREVRLAAGAGYVYAICGAVSTMPGLPSHPAAQRIDVDTATGEITGLR